MKALALFMGNGAVIWLQNSKIRFDLKCEHKHTHIWSWVVYKLGIYNKNRMEEIIGCLLANVLSSEHNTASLALKAADMPLFLQCQERLALLDLILTACTV